MAESRRWQRIIAHAEHSILARESRTATSSVPAGMLSVAASLRARQAINGLVAVAPVGVAVAATGPTATGAATTTAVATLARAAIPVAATTAVAARTWAGASWRPIRLKLLL